MFILYANIWHRIGLKQFIKQDKQIPILLIMFPTMGQNFAFLYPFSHTLLSKVHENLKKIHSYTLFPILTLISQYRFNLLEFLLFPLMRYLMGIVFILALFIPQHRPTHYFGQAFTIIPFCYYYIIVK